MQNINERLEQLERHNRWLKRGFLLLAVAVTGQYLLGAGMLQNKTPAAPAGVQQFDTVHLKTLVVGEPQKQRIQMTTQHDGSFFIMYDEAGTQRWRVAAKKSGTYSQMYDIKGKLIKQQKN